LASLSGLEFSLQIYMELIGLGPQEIVENVPTKWMENVDEKCEDVMRRKISYCMI
jgi:hypothetical protein